MNQPSGFQVRGSAPDHYAEFNAPIMAPFVGAVLQRAGISAGDSVLDIACGTGFTTQRAAEIVGPSGRVVGLDVNPGMLAKARSMSVGSGVPVTWQEGSALDLPFDASEFERVVCQQGIQFFSDLSRATREMARVLRPGGSLAVSFWAPLADQTYMAAQITGLLDVLGDVARPLAAAFELDPALVAEALNDAGLENVIVDKISAEVILPADLTEFARGQLMALPVADAFAALPPDRQARYLSHVVDTLSGTRNADGNYRCAFASWVFSAAAADVVEGAVR